MLTGQNITDPRPDDTIKVMRRNGFFGDMSLATLIGQFPAGVGNLYVSNTLTVGGTTSLGPTTVTSMYNEGNESIVGTLNVTGNTTLSEVTGGAASFTSLVVSGPITSITMPTPDNSTAVATTAFVKNQGYLTTASMAGYAPLASPAFTGVPTGPTAAPGDISAQLATDAFVARALTGFAPIASPTLTGTPKSVTAAPGDNSTQIATDAFVMAALASYAPLASPLFTGVPKGPTGSPGDASTQLATDAFVQAALTAYAPINSPALTGTPTAPTPSGGDSSNKIATTAFVSAATGGTGSAPINNPTFTGTVTLPANNIINGPPETYRELHYQSAGSDRWVLFADGSTEGSGNVGSDFYIQRADNTGAYLGNPFVIRRGTGNVEIAQQLTVENGLTVNGPSGGATLNISSAAGTYRELHFQSNGSDRWIIGAEGDAEGGTSGGSDLQFYREDNNGNFIDVPFQIDRGTGNVHVNDALYVTPYVAITGAAGTARSVYFQSSGSNRWQICASTDGEGSGNTGSIFEIQRYDNNGNYVDVPFAIFRDTGKVQLTDGGTSVTPAYNDSSGNIATTAYVQKAAGSIIITEFKVNANQANFLFSNIPQNFQHLRLIISGQCTGGYVPLYLQFNGDNGGNYSYTYMAGYNGAVTSGSGVGTTTASIGNMSNNSYYPSTAIVDIPEYTNTSGEFFKTFTSTCYSVNGGPGSGAQIQTNGGFWNSGSAINSILVFLPGTDTFVNGTIMSLFGVN